MDWYYEKRGEQLGPVSEEALKALFDRSEIRSDNLVWREGMADWATYGSVFGNAAAVSPAGVTGAPTESSGERTRCPSCGARVDASELIPAGDRPVCPNCRDRFTQGLREGVRRPMTGPGDRGTGGQTPNSELRSYARDALSGTWGMAVLVVFLFSIIQQACAIVPIAGDLVQWAIVGPLTLGMTGYFLTLVRSGPAETGMLFSGFSNFWLGLGIYFVTWVLVGLAALAAAIPGGILIAIAHMGPGIPEENPLFVLGIFLAIIPAMAAVIYMYLRYALAYYIAYDYPEAGVLMAVKRSTQMMNGHKSKLFGLYFSFIGWHFLGLLALGIGLLWSLTYMWTALAAFYEDLGEEA